MICLRGSGVCSQPCHQHIHSRGETTFYTPRKANHWTQKTYWHRIYTPSILSTHVSLLHNPYQFLPRTPQRRILLPVISLTSCPREFLRPALLLGPEFLVVRLCVHLQLAEIRADDFFAAIRALFAISHILYPHPVSPSLVMHHAPQRGKQLPPLRSLFFLIIFASFSPLNNGHGNVQFVS